MALGAGEFMMLFLAKVVVSLSYFVYFICYLVSFYFLCWLSENRGNKLLWDYDPSQDEEIYEAYRAVRNAGVTIFDTADSYGKNTQH